MKQDEAFEILKTGANVFLTGAPGSGKTHLVNMYVRYLRTHKIGVAVTASTGIAATHIGGMTIHSWSGIGIRNVLTSQDLERLSGKRRLKSRAKKTEVLIIDEISMLDAMVLDAVDIALQALRENKQPFGGLQVVFVGDFFQLPPVVREGETVFAFASLAWQSAKPAVCYLAEQHRQHDEALSHLLLALRQGRREASLIKMLSERPGQVGIEEEVTRLYSHNVDVDRLNDDKLASLPEAEETYAMTSKGRRMLVEQLKRGCLSPETLVLKVEAKVMFTKNNFEEGFVNGTLGEVVDFEDGWPWVKTRQGQMIQVTPMEWMIEEHGKPIASIFQLPLRLAWAITIHKSQGMTLDAAVMDLSATFEYGQGYVALSRVTSISGLYLLGINERALEVHPDILVVDEVFLEQSNKALRGITHYGVEVMKQKQDDFVRRVGGTLEELNEEKKLSTYDKTLALYQQGMGIEEMAEERGYKLGTIIGHLERLLSDGRIDKEGVLLLLPKKLVRKLDTIGAFIDTQEDDRLSPVYSHFKGTYSYDELRLVRLLWGLLEA